MSNILQMSTVLIFAVVLLRAAFGKRMSMRLRYALWLPVAIRLLLPFQIGQSAISFANVLESAEKIRPVVMTYNPVPATMPTSATVPEQSQSPLQMVWYAGIAVTALWFLFVNIRFYYRARKGAERMPYRGFRVFVSKGISSPCQIGSSIFLTPEVAANEQSLKHVLAHEKTHFYHGDTFWSLLRAALVCVYWFFPPVWIAAILSKRDCELACDEGALRRIGEQERFAYGKTLLSVAAQASVTQRVFCTATTMAQSKQELSTRIKVISMGKRGSIFLTVLLIVLMGMSTVCTFAGKATATNRPIERPVQTTFDDAEIETTAAQEIEEQPTAIKPLPKPRPEPVATEELTEALPTEPSEQTEEAVEVPAATQTYSQSEMPYEAQADSTKDAASAWDVPAALRSHNMGIPSENYEAPEGYNLLDGLYTPNPNYVIDVNDSSNYSNVGPQPAIPYVGPQPYMPTPETPGVVINWGDPYSAPYIGYP